MASTIRGNDNFDSANANIALQTAIATTSGTSHDFTGIPAGVKRITVMLSGVSTNGTSVPIVQLNNQASGYGGASLNSGTVAIYPASGFPISISHTAAFVLNAGMTLSRLDASSFAWVNELATARTDAVQIYTGAGVVTLAGELTSIRLTTVNGTDLFNAGSVNISYEY